MKRTICYKGFSLPHLEKRMWGCLASMCANVYAPAIGVKDCIGRARRTAFTGKS